MSRQRREAANAPMGAIVPLPKLLPIVARPKGWRRLPDAQKSAICLGLGFDRAFDYLSWDPNNIDAHRLSAQKELVRAMIQWVFRKYLEDRKDGRAESALLSKLAEKLLMPEYGGGSSNGSQVQVRARKSAVSGRADATTSSAAQPQDAE